MSPIEHLHIPSPPFPWPTLATALRCVAMVIFAWMILHGAVCWSMRNDRDMPMWYGFACVWVGVFGLVLVDISMTLAAMRTHQEGL